MDVFLGILEKGFGVNLTEKEKRVLRLTFPGRNEGARVRISV
jgi:hypothetical protein